MALTPKIDNEHFHEALVKLAMPFWGKPRIAALLQAMVNQVQGFEDEVWEVLERYTLDGADDARLAVLGRIVGQHNAGWTTEEYRAVLRGKIRANSSCGRADDIIEVIVLVMQLTTEVVHVYHYSPATAAVLPASIITSFELEALNFLLPKTRSAGVQVHYFFAPEGLGDYDFESTGIDLDDTTDPGSVDPGLFDVRLL